MIKPNCTICKRLLNISYTMSAYALYTCETSHFAFSINISDSSINYSNYRLCIPNDIIVVIDFNLNKTDIWFSVTNKFISVNNILNLEDCNNEEDIVKKIKIFCTFT